MDKKPRIAFCFSGQARTLDQTYLFFQKNFFDAAKEQGFDYDVFCVIEDDEDVEKVKLLNPTKVEKIKSSDVVHIINDKYGDFIKNELYKYGYFISSGVYSLLQQIYKVQRSILLTKDENYDLILRLRFDTIFFNKFNFNYILNEINKKGGIICNSAHINYVLTRIKTTSVISYLKIVDLYFIGGNDMKKFGEIFDTFPGVVASDHKTYNILNPIYRVIFDSIMFIEKLNKKLVKVSIPITPINLIAKLFGLQIFVGDSYYYKFLKNIKLHKTNIGLIILRKDAEKSDFRLHQKTKFEI